MVDFQLNEIREKEGKTKGNPTGSLCICFIFSILPRQLVRRCMKVQASYLSVEFSRFICPLRRFMA